MSKRRAIQHLHSECEKLVREIEACRAWPTEQVWRWFLDRCARFPGETDSGTGLASSRGPPNDGQALFALRGSSLRAEREISGHSRTGLH